MTGSALPLPAATSADPVLRVKGVSCRWGTRTALEDVSFEIPAGQIFGLIGPNGAGKTTLVRAVAGRAPLAGGEIQVLGAAAGTRAARSALGLVPQLIALYPFQTARENLETFARLSGVPGASVSRVARRALERVGLAGSADRITGELSGGMQRRLNIAAGLLHDPRLLLLDEPTVGIDVAGRESVHDLLRGLRSDGVAVLLTTHDLDQTTELADRVGVLSLGRLVAVGAPADLVRQAFGGDRELQLSLTSAATGPAREILERHGLRMLAEGRRWTGRLHGGLTDVGSLQSRLESEGVAVEEIRIREPSLRSVFFQLTGEDLAP
jgi:ABC-2 type transport system ATP-binding protein